MLVASSDPRLGVGIMNEMADLFCYPRYDRIVHFSPDEGRIRFDDDIVGTAIFNYGPLLAKRVELRAAYWSMGETCGRIWRTSI